MDNWLLLMIVAVISSISLWAYCVFARKIGLVEQNYRGVKIPVSTGIIIPVVFLPLYFLFEIEHVSHFKMKTYLALLLLLGTVGFLDDWIGRKEIKGLKGHLTYFLVQKKVSTGLVKLIAIALLGFAISFAHLNKSYDILLGSLTFAVWTNIINLLDVRPGRAIKGFWLFSLVIFFLHSRDFEIVEVLFLILSGLLFEVDRREWGMLGDAGANLFGGLIGCWLVIWATPLERFCFLLVGVWITLYAERHSISKWIESHPLIERLDQWGRNIMD